MARSIPSGIASAITNASTRPFYAVDLLFDAPNQLYFHTGIGNKTIGSVTYQGVGDLLKISAVRSCEVIKISLAVLLKLE